MSSTLAQMPEKEQPIIVQLHGRSIDKKDMIWDETGVFFRVGAPYLITDQIVRTNMLEA